MNNLVFLHNELLNPQLYRNQLRIPLEFICFGIIDGKMYSHFGQTSTFILPNSDSKDWGNTKIYGAIFLVKEIDFYISLLDAYHMCSMTNLRRNHIKDVHHRKIVSVIPIFFDTLDDLSKLKYEEGEEIEATTYFGNIEHPKINQRFVTTASYRLVDGINRENYTKLFRRMREWVIWKVIKMQ